MNSTRAMIRFTTFALAVAMMTGCAQTVAPSRSSVLAGPNGGAARQASSIQNPKIFVSESSPTMVLTFLQSDSGNVAPQREIDGSGAGALAFDGVAVSPDGNIYVVDNVDQKVLAYQQSESGPATPLLTISCAGFNGPSSLDFDRQGHLYISNGGSAPFSISILPSDASGCVTGNQSIVGDHTGLYNPQGIQSRDAGRLFVLNNRDSVTEYAPGANGDSGWTHKIHGPDTLLNTNSECGNAIYVDGSGVIYVANANGNSITVYSPSADGDAKPMRDIVGPSTGLDEPRALTVNSGGKIFVVNSGSGSITVYDRTANGNASPIQTIAGSKTKLTGFAAGIARSL